MGVNWLIRLYRFRVRHHLFPALCAHHPESKLLLSPYIWPQTLSYPPPPSLWDHLPVACGHECLPACVSCVFACGFRCDIPVWVRSDGHWLFLCDLLKSGRITETHFRVIAACKHPAGTGAASLGFELLCRSVELSGAASAVSDGKCVPQGFANCGWIFISAMVCNCNQNEVCAVQMIQYDNNLFWLVFKWKAIATPQLIKILSWALI